MKASLTCDDAIIVSNIFERTWINGFWTALIYHNGELFRTNNNAEAFHSSLKRLFFTEHPPFDEFVEKID